MTQFLIFAAVMAPLAVLVFASWIRHEMDRAILLTEADEERIWREALGAGCQAEFRPCDGCVNGCGCEGGSR